MRDDEFYDTSPDTIPNWISLLLILILLASTCVFGCGPGPANTNWPGRTP